MLLEKFLGRSIVLVHRPPPFGPPTLSPRVVRIAMWTGGIVLGMLLLLVAGMLVFGPAADDNERDHRPSSVGLRTNEVR